MNIGIKNHCSADSVCKNEDSFCINGFAPGYQNDFWQAESLLKVFKYLKREEFKCLTGKTSEEGTEVWLV